jgi:hypothetical protein
MASIIVNGRISVDGHFTVQRFIDKTKKPNVMVITGQFTTSRYFDEITSLESEHTKINGVDVLGETFGSDDSSILYDFIAMNIVVKENGDEHNGNG